MRLLRLPGVYGPGDDSWQLSREIEVHARPADRVLDVFSGSGVQAVTAARAGVRDVWAVDVSRRSMLSIALNARLNGVRITARRGELFEPVADERFDLIVANPPFVPSGIDDSEPRGSARAWEGGLDGRRLLDPFLTELPAHLAPGGRVLIVQSALSDADRTLAALREAGLEAEVVDCDRAPLGPITAPRARHLEDRGLLEPGERVEETVVIGGALPAPAPAPHELEPSLAASASA